MVIWWWTTARAKSVPVDKIYPLFGAVEGVAFMGGTSLENLRASEPTDEGGMADGWCLVFVMLFRSLWAHWMWGREFRWNEVFGRTSIS